MYNMPNVACRIVSALRQEPGGDSLAQQASPQSRVFLGVHAITELVLLLLVNEHEVRGIVPRIGRVG
jgi:hypothetical protein